MFAVILDIGLRIILTALIGGSMGRAARPLMLSLMITYARYGKFPTVLSVLSSFEMKDARYGKFPTVLSVCHSPE